MSRPSAHPSHSLIHSSHKTCRFVGASPGAAAPLPPAHLGRRCDQPPAALAVDGKGTVVSLQNIEYTALRTTTLAGGCRTSIQALLSRTASLNCRSRRRRRTDGWPPIRRPLLGVHVYTCSLLLLVTTEQGCRTCIRLQARTRPDDTDLPIAKRRSLHY